MITEIVFVTCRIVSLPYDTSGYSVVFDDYCSHDVLCTCGGLYGRKKWLDLEPGLVENQTPQRLYVYCLSCVCLLPYVSTPRFRASTPARWLEYTSYARLIVFVHY